ncbi:MAG: polyphosphate kinase 2 family protein [Planctomycetota bacterium]
MPTTNDYRVKPGSKAKLSDWDPENTAGLDREDAEAKLEANRERIAELQYKMYAEGKRALLVIFQAMDAAGKDSTTRHVFKGVNPTGIEVTSFKKPSEEELAHDFLWRIHKAVPARGSIGVFNRSHYEDVLVVRVEDLVPKKVWSRRYELIRAFESQLRQAGTEIVKIYLHISKEQQRRRLLKRITDPKRHWKFNAADFEARAKWDDYREAYEDALAECSTEDAPWHVVPADHKWFRKYLVSEIVREALERIDPKYPGPEIDPAEAMALVERYD